MTELLDLPPEIRLLIGEALWEPIIKPSKMPDDSIPWCLPAQYHTSRQLSLLLTCRQIHAELWRVAYSRVTFHAKSLSYLTACTETNQLQPEKMAAIRSVAVYGTSHIQKISLLLQRLSGIEEFLFLHAKPPMPQEAPFSGFRRRMQGRIASYSFRLYKIRQLNGDEDESVRNRLVFRVNGTHEFKVAVHDRQDRWVSITLCYAEPPII